MNIQIEAIIRKAQNILANTLPPGSIDSINPHTDRMAWLFIRICSNYGYDDSKHWSIKHIGPLLKSLRRIPSLTKDIDDIFDTTQFSYAFEINRFATAANETAFIDTSSGIKIIQLIWDISCLFGGFMTTSYATPCLFYLLYLLGYGTSWYESKHKNEKVNLDDNEWLFLVISVLNAELTFIRNGGFLDDLEWDRRNYTHCKQVDRNTGDELLDRLVSIEEWPQSWIEHGTFFDLTNLTIMDSLFNLASSVIHKYIHVEIAKDALPLKLVDVVYSHA